MIDDPDFEDLNPVITYRHILSRNLGVRDPLRVIALCDSDAFYAGCEMNRLGVADDVPLVVLQWESLIAVNYPARKYGISRMCKKKDALKMCPHLLVVHVATYKEGEKEPGYWDNVDTNTHKARTSDYLIYNSPVTSGSGLAGLLSPRKHEDCRPFQGTATRMRNRFVLLSVRSPAMDHQTLLCYSSRKKRRQ